MIITNFSNKKDIILKLISDIYKLTDTEDAEYAPCQYCNGVCEDNEKGEIVTFLPFEKEHIYNSVSKGGSIISGKIIKSISNNHPSLCPFLNNRCSLHKYRPFDCRSYPLVPYFKKDGSWEIFYAEKCPYTQETTKPFFNVIVDSWNMIFPHLSEGWKQNYNRKQSYLELTDKKSR
jgi:Fe-S-cluster containining protein